MYVKSTDIPPLLQRVNVVSVFANLCSRCSRLCNVRLYLAGVVSVVDKRAYNTVVDIM